MIHNISLTTVWVKDIDESKAFYVDKLGFEPRDDVRLGDDFRWCTIGHPSQPELDVHLSTPGPPLSPDYVNALNRALDDGGTFTVGLRVEDCRSDRCRARGERRRGPQPTRRPPLRCRGAHTGQHRQLAGAGRAAREFSQEEMEAFAGDDPSSLNPLAG